MALQVYRGVVLGRSSDTAVLMVTPWEVLQSVRAADDRQTCSIVFPDRTFEHDVAGFARTILGYEPTAVQCKAFEAYVKYPRVLWQSGRKNGKSRFLATLALHRYCTCDKSTTILCAPCHKQIDAIVYRDLQKLVIGSGICVSCRRRYPDLKPPCPHSARIDGMLSPTSMTGLRSGPDRQIIGFAPLDEDHARGPSDHNMLIVIDEAPGVRKEIAETLHDAVAGGGKFIAAGNPSCRGDWFYEKTLDPEYHVVVSSCLDQPNVKFGRILQPGLVQSDWVELRRREWGEDDPRWATEVLGQFPAEDMSRLISKVELGEAFRRYEMMPDPVEGHLQVGIDPAYSNDLTAITWRRGNKVLGYRSFIGATDRTMSELEPILASLQRWPTEEVHIAFDSSSNFGTDLAHALSQMRTRKCDWVLIEPLEARGDRSKDWVLRESGCARRRDAMWVNMANRLKTDVGIPYSSELEEELLAAEYLPDRTNGTLVTEQKSFRKLLGRSPDRANSLMYCLWEGRVGPLSKAAKEPETPLQFAMTPDDVREWGMARAGARQGIGTRLVGSYRVGSRGY